MKRGSDAREIDPRTLINTTNSRTRDVRELPIQYKIFEQDVISALKGRQVMLTPYIYEDRGNDLWADVVRDYKKEYYATLADQEILNLHGKEIAQIIGSNVNFISFGPGSEVAVREKEVKLMRQIANVKGYFPVDHTQINIDNSIPLVKSYFPNIITKGINTDFIIGEFKFPQDRPAACVQFGTSLPNICEEETRDEKFIPKNTISFLNKIYNEVTVGST
jgi:uncharacterized SAM-dependent methyltransferase